MQHKTRTEQEIMTDINDLRLKIQKMLDDLKEASAKLKELRAELNDIPTNWEKA
jgi:hypothetical protein